MVNINNLFSRGKPLTASDCVDRYTTFAFNHQLTNYRMFTLESLIKSPPLVKGSDIPDYLFDLIAEDKVLGIANMVDDQALYIIFRSLKEKKFFTFGLKRPVPYGIKDFHNFQYGDPIVVVEGLKDRDAMSLIYPYTIASQTAGIGLIQYEILKTLTNNIILCFDDDESGRKAMARESRKLSKDFTVHLMKHPQGVKDSGTMADLEVDGNFFDLEFLKTWYEAELRTILGSNYDVLLSKSRDK